MEKGEGRTRQAAEPLPAASLLVTPPWTLINSKQLLGLIPCWYITDRSGQMELENSSNNSIPSLKRFQHNRSTQIIP